MRRHLHSHRLSAAIAALGLIALPLQAHALGLGGQGNLVGNLAAQPRQLQADAFGEGRGRLALDSDRLRRAERRALAPTAEGQGALTSSNALKNAAPAEGQALPRPGTLESSQLLQGAGQLGATRGEGAAPPPPATSPEPVESAEPAPAPAPAPAKPPLLSGEGRAATQANASGPRGRQTQVSADGAGQGSAKPGQVQGNGRAAVRRQGR